MVKVMKKLNQSYSDLTKLNTEELVGMLSDSLFIGAANHSIVKRRRVT